MPRRNESTPGRGCTAALVLTAAAALVGGCAAPPPVVGYTVEIPAGVRDASGRFREVYCAVLQQHGRELPDYRPCETALSPMAKTPKGTGEPVPLGASGRRLIAAVVPGIGYACIKEWLSAPGIGAIHLGRYGYGQLWIEVDALSGIETNARQVRDAIMARPAEAGPPRLVLIGYSKGAPDILEAVVRYPEIRDRLAAVVSAAGAVSGSVLANDADQHEAELLRHWPGAECDRGDGGAVASMRPEVRRQWLASNPLPAGLRYYSLVTLPTPDRVSRVIERSYEKLGSIDWRNDSQLIYSDQIIPGSTLMGFLNADHWAIAIPINRSHPQITSTFVDQNDYPREALLEAVLRFVEEDLDRQATK